MTMGSFRLLLGLLGGMVVFVVGFSMGRGPAPKGPTEAPAEADCTALEYELAEATAALELVDAPVPWPPGPEVPPDHVRDVVETYLEELHGLALVVLDCEPYPCIAGIAEYQPDRWTGRLSVRRTLQDDLEALRAPDWVGIRAGARGRGRALVLGQPYADAVPDGQLTMRVEAVLAKIVEQWDSRRRPRDPLHRKWNAIAKYRDRQDLLERRLEVLEADRRSVVARRAILLGEDP